MNTTSAGLDGRVCAAAHRRADVRAGEYGRIVDAVADEHDRAALLADFGQRRQLILREQAGAHLVDADRLRDRVRAGLTVTGQHGRASDPAPSCGRWPALASGLDGIGDVDMTEERDRRAPAALPCCPGCRGSRKGRYCCAP